jgi:hypothetical protein
VAAGWGYAQAGSSKRTVKRSAARFIILSPHEIEGVTLLKSWGNPLSSPSWGRFCPKSLR